MNGHTYNKCTLCGAGVQPAGKKDICWRCRKKLEARSPRLEPGHGRRIRLSGIFTTCKMPRCRKRFELSEYQDKKYTWYCPDCRKEVAEITSGLTWLGNIGVDISAGDDGDEAILMDSTAKAYEEADNEAVLLQQKQGIPGGGVAAGHGLPPQPEHHGPQEEAERGGSDL